MKVSDVKGERTGTHTHTHLYTQTAMHTHMLLLYIQSQHPQATVHAYTDSVTIN